MKGEASAADVLNRNFLEMRSRLLDVAAALDRVDRGTGLAAARADARWSKLHEALGVLAAGRPDRAERVQMIFSLPYDDGWRGMQGSANQ
jgi:hypothetical protein